MTLNEGEIILATLREQATAHANKLSGVGRHGDQYPPDYRRRIRTETLAQLDTLMSRARSAFNSWMTKEAVDARRILGQDPVGSAADESRRVANELRTSRLVDAGRRQDERSGGRVVNDGHGGNRLVGSGAAVDYESQAQQAFLDGDYDKALAYAEAANALGGTGRADQVISAARQMQYTPEQLGALKHLETLDRAYTVFERDANAAMSDALQRAAEGAAAIGDDHRLLQQTAADHSRRAKVAAYALAERSEDGAIVPGSYKEPAGVLAGPA